jgi:hypothetical protein
MKQSLQQHLQVMVMVVVWVGGMVLREFAWPGMVYFPCFHFGMS